jgi:hypothetical protein
MAPPSWADAEQTEFLQSYFDQYYKVQESGKFIDFWAIVHQAWFSRWHALAAQFPGKEANKLTDVERKDLGHSIKTMKAVRVLIHSSKTH